MAEKEKHPFMTMDTFVFGEWSLDEMVALLKQALNYKQRTTGRNRIIEMGLSNEQVAQRLVAIYESVLA